MRSHTCAGLLCLFVAVGAWAQDNQWRGFYVGGNVGASIADSDATTSTIFSSTGYFATTSVPAIATAGLQFPASTGVTGGGQAGYNYQSGPWVLGAELDFGAMDLSDTRTTTAVYPCCAPSTFTVTQSLKTSWVFTARPRIGYAAGKFLLYGTGGLAVTNLNYQALFTDTFASAHENRVIDESKLGWTAGGGVEYKAARHWSFKGEYLYADFGRVSATSSNLTAPAVVAWPSNVFTHTTDLRTHIVRFGVNYHF